jgi:hypothetical protein
MPKYLKIGSIGRTVEEVSVTIGGAESANKIPELDASGVLDSSMMPPGIGSDTIVIVASENLAQNDLVNIWNSSSTFKARKADAGTNKYEAHGYVKAAVTSGNNATVYRDGDCAGTFQASDAGKLVFASDTAGGITLTPVSGSGKLHQIVGHVVSLTAYDFEGEPPIELV